MKNGTWLNSLAQYLQRANTSNLFYGVAVWLTVNLKTFQHSGRHSHKHMLEFILSFTQSFNHSLPYQLTPTRWNTCGGSVWKGYDGLGENYGFPLFSSCNLSHILTSQAWQHPTLPATQCWLRLTITAWRAGAKVRKALLKIKYIFKKHQNVTGYCTAVLIASCTT